MPIELAAAGLYPAREARTGARLWPRLRHHSALAFLADVWALARPYWQSEERAYARLMLGALLAVKAATIWICIQQNHWYNSFYGALQTRELAAFWSQVALFCAIGASLVVSQVASHWIGSCLKTSWRSFAVRHMATDWLTDRAYYRLQAENTCTDPDRRIAEDVGAYVDRTLDLGVGFLDVSVALLAFTSILWTLSGCVEVGSLALPGSMVIGAFAYALTSTWITHRLGHPLARLYDRRATQEADFRHGLVRLMDNAETIAFYGGEAREEDHLGRRFAAVVETVWTTLRHERRLGIFTHTYGQASIIVPFLLAAPRYFAGAISFGEVMQVAAAFGSVVACLNYLIHNYGQVAHWRADVARLTAFRSSLDQCRAIAAPLTVEEGSCFAVRDLDLALPNGRPLLSVGQFALEPGASVLIKAPSGTGKSTLLRAIAGLWPQASGQVTLPAGQVFFVPQRPYLPLGTLRDAILYPSAAADDDTIRSALEAVGLAHLVPHLDSENLHLTLSGGEQQRIAVARILVARPATIILDEATSALDEAMERRIYRMLRDAEWKPTIISVGHRSTLEALHDAVWELKRAA